LFSQNDLQAHHAGPCQHRRAGCACTDHSGRPVVQRRGEAQTACEPRRCSQQPRACAHDNSAQEQPIETVGQPRCRRELLAQRRHQRRGLGVRGSRLARRHARHDKRDGRSAALDEQRADGLQPRRLPFQPLDCRVCLLERDARLVLAGVEQRLGHPQAFLQAGFGRRQIEVGPFARDGLAAVARAGRVFQARAGGVEHACGICLVLGARDGVGLGRRFVGAAHGLRPHALGLRRRGLKTLLGAQFLCGSLGAQRLCRPHKRPLPR